MTAGTLVRLAVELLVLLALCLVLRARGESLREMFALVPVPGATLAGWVAAFALLVAGEALLKPILGFSPVRPWEGHYSDTGILIRLVGIVLVAPVAEELIFRGAAFARLARTGLEAPGAIPAPAPLFPPPPP